MPSFTDDLVNEALKEIAKVRSRSSWNDRFWHWEKSASETEEAQIERAAVAVRRAIARRPRLTTESVEVRPQGSYFNNTNVRQESDMDLCAWHRGLMVHTAPDVNRTEAFAALGYSDAGLFIPNIARDLRQEVEYALREEFGKEHLHPGKKAFRVSAIPGSRADADVVPALALHFIVRGSNHLLVPYEVIEGVVITDTSGIQIFNFPQQHFQNGKTKRLSTQHRFKKAVRTLKVLRDELVALGQLKKGQAPSFLIESLVYAIEDTYFLEAEDRYARVRRILQRMWDLLSDGSWLSTAREINMVKMLFHDTQPWKPEDAKAFVLAAWRRLEL
jgi:hypothetical protein